MKRGDLLNRFTVDGEWEKVVVLGRLLEVDYHFFRFLYVQTEVVPHFLPVGSLIANLKM